MSASPDTEICYYQYFNGTTADASLIHPGMAPFPHALALSMNTPTQGIEMSRARQQILIQDAAFIICMSVNLLPNLTRELNDAVPLHYRIVISHSFRGGTAILSYPKGT
jgi:hypothetical protein